MQINTEKIAADMQTLLEEILTENFLQNDAILVVGCSTSEVAGERIGTAGSEEIAAQIFASLKNLKQQKEVHFAFQCCEHLNRALVVEKATMDRLNLEAVSVIPVPKAGGSMASFAYKHLENPVVVEHIKADAGMDIGETMIGMHLKQVAVPLRFQQKYIGQARVNVARTRPKLIGGSRAVYDLP